MYATAFAILSTLAFAAPLTRVDNVPNLERATIDLCIVSLIDDVDVPAQEAGPLVVIAAKENDVVEVGTLVAQVDDRQAQLSKYAAELQRNAAATRAADDLEVRLAEATYGVADAELEQNLDINRRRPKTIPETEIRRLRLARDRALLQIDKSKLDMRIVKMNAEVEDAAVKAADNSIERRRIVSPINGTVVEIHRQIGEWVDAGEPVMRIVRMDRLHVEGFLKASDYDPAEVAGRSVTVEVELARGRRVSFPGKVVHVSPLVQAGNKYRVRAEVENRSERGHWLLRPGALATMTIHLK